MLTEGLVLEGVEGGASAVVIVIFASEVDDGEFLLLADIELIDEFIV